MIFASDRTFRNITRVTTTLLHHFRPSTVRKHLTHVSSRQLLGTSFTNLALTFIPTGLLLARFLGPTARGEIVIILQWPAFLGSVLSIGLGRSTCYWTATTKYRCDAVLATASFLAAVIGIVLALLGPIIAPLITTTPDVLHMLLLMFLLAPFNIVGGIWSAYLQAVDIRRWNIGRSIQTPLFTVGVIGLWFSHHLTVATTSYAFGLSLIIQTTYLFMSVRRHAHVSLIPHLGITKDLLAYGTKEWAGSTPRLVNVSIDQILLSVWPGISTAQLGIYSVGVTLSGVTQPLTQALGSLAFPRIARSRDQDTASAIQRSSLSLAASTSVLLQVILCLSAPILVPVLFGNSFHPSVEVIWLLAPGSVMLGISHVSAEIVKGRGKPLTASIAELLGAAITIGLLIVLVPRFGINGAAATSTIAYGVVLLYLARYALRLRAIPAVVEPT